MPGCVGEGEAAGGALALGSVETGSRAVVHVGDMSMVEMMVDMTVDMSVETGSRVVVLVGAPSMVDMAVDMTVDTTVDMATVAFVKLTVSAAGVSLEATQ